MNTKFDIGDYVEAQYIDKRKKPSQGYIIEININDRRDILYRIGNRWFFESKVIRLEEEKTK